MSVPSKNFQPVTQYQIDKKVLRNVEEFKVRFSKLKHKKDEMD